ncbi:MAG: TauD/TfdA family dioxygenase [Chloroflexota bacterium]
MMTQQINHPAAWKGSDLTSEDMYAFDLEQRHLDALVEAVAGVKHQNKQLKDVNQQDFAMSTIAADLATVRHELTQGRGFVMIRGFPINDYSLDEIGLMYWGLGTHFGKGMSQSRYGDRLGYVTHDPDLDEFGRGYRSKKALGMHTDANDIISLLCIRRAKVGGASRLTSALAVHNEIAATRPDLLAPLYEGYYFHWFSEAPPDTDKPVSDYKIPVLSFAEETLSVCYLRGYMRYAAEAIGTTLPDQLVEALDLFDEITNRADMVHEFSLEAGNAYFVNNYVMMHGRAYYEDWEEPERRRLLLRLWLEQQPSRPVHPNLRRYYDDLKRAYTRNDK